MKKNRKSQTAACWRLPVWTARIFRPFYYLHFAVADFFRWIYRVFYAGPLFEGRCSSVGRGFYTMKIPDATSQCNMTLGDDVAFLGHVGVGSGRVFDAPAFSIGNRVTLGPTVFFTASKEVRIGDDVRIGGGSRIMDSDGHPRDTAARVADMPPPADEIKSIHIGSKVDIGRKSIILKGVTIGEGAQVGVNSVVVANVPAYTVVAGNPARLVSRKQAPSTAAVGNE